MKQNIIHSQANVFRVFLSLSLCILLFGCGGGGSSSTSTTTTIPATTTTVLLTTTTVPPTTTTVLPSPDALIGNFKIVYKISTSTFTDKITMDKKTTDKTSEGEFYYSGYNADAPSVTLAMGAWAPSLSKYLIVAGLVWPSVAPFLSGYVFSINADNTLSGCYMLSGNSGNTWSPCYSFIPPSIKSPLGSWDMSMESQNKPIDINEVNLQKFNEDQEAEAQRTESEVKQDSNLISKLNEIKALLKK